MLAPGMMCMRRRLLVGTDLDNTRFDWIMDMRMSGSNDVQLAAIFFAMLMLFGPSAANGQPEDTAAQEVAIRATGKAYVEAVQRGDANAMAAAWTKDGSYTDETGRSFNAQTLIEQKYGPQATTEEARTTQLVEIDIKSTLRFVSAGVAVEEGIHQSPDAAGGFTAIWVKTKQGWKLDHLIEHASVPGLQGGALEALSWMIGDWVGQGQGNDLTVMCSANWSENRKFIVRHFSVKQGGQQVLTGTQRIGWHPGSKTIRSWVFDSSGGIVEGRWRQEGDAWIVKTTGVSADGSSSSAINFWIREGTDSCALKSSHVKVGETEVEDAVLEFRRINN